MSTCPGCGGIVGRDCFNPQECQWIAQQMAQDPYQGQQPEDPRIQQHYEELHAQRAVAYANRLGIYAVPFRNGSTIYWRPRLSSGHDPQLSWLIANEPTIKGWLSWDDAVVALGKHLDDHETKEMNS